MESIIKKSIKSVAASLVLSAALTSNIWAQEGGKVYLTKETASTKESYWRVLNNQSVSGAELKIKGETFIHGLGVHADSKITYKVKPEYKFFHVVPGADDAHHGSFIMKILLDNKEVYNSGTINSGKQKNPEAQLIDLSGVKELTLIVEQGEDGKGGDHADWASAFFVTNADGTFEPEPVKEKPKLEYAPERLLATTKIKVKAKHKKYLTKELATSNKSYWKVDNNKSVSGGDLKIQGKTFARGIGVHASSKLTFNITPEDRFFHVVPGADDAHTGKITMRILVDNKEVFNTEEISSRTQDAPESVVVDLAGAKELTLIVEEGKDKGGDHADWADAYFINKKSI